MRAGCGGIAAVWCCYAVHGACAGLLSGWYHDLTDEVDGPPSNSTTEASSGGEGFFGGESIWSKAKEVAGSIAERAEGSPLSNSTTEESSGGEGFFGGESIWSKAKEVAGSIAERAEGLKDSAEEELSSAVNRDWIPLEEKNELEGHSTAFNNGVLVGLFVAVAFAAAAGHVLEVFLLPDLKASGHPRGWVVGVLVASYCILVPAIQETLFSFNIFMSLRMGHHGEMGYNLTRHPVTESMMSVIHLLFKTGGSTGASCVILYAMVLPAVKLALLLLGELWRKSESARLRRVSSASILLVQLTSKWASPDLFAYILLLFLFRHLDHPPMVESNAVLDVGFACFGVFCLCSTFSTLAIHRPEPQYKDLGGPPLLLRLGREAALLVTCVMIVIFGVLLVAGLRTPCMGLHLDDGILLKPKGPVPRSMKWVLDDAISALDLKPMLRAEVSLWHCMCALGSYIEEGEAALVMAFVMLSVFAVALTIADMAMLGLAVLSTGGPNLAMSTSRVLKHISMLDVFCMGVFVVCMAGKAYSSVGFNLSLRAGLLPLVGAEAVHYVTFSLVSGAADYTEDNEAIREEKLGNNGM